MYKSIILFIRNLLRRNMKELKVKKLTDNKRGFTHMAIDVSESKTVIYLHGLSKDSVDQWYESKGEFTKKTALNYFYAGQYKVVFAQGMTKSNVKDWI